MKEWFFLAILIFAASLYSNNQEYTLTKEEEETVEFVNWCITQAEQHESKLNQDVLGIEGMSSAKGRHFLNNLCSRPNTHLLEIGCWKGSTLIASLFHNDMTHAVAIDNWCQVGRAASIEFHENCTRFLHPNQLNYQDVDCFEINPKDICTTPVNVYFYDGRHDIEDQTRAFVHYNDVFDDLFIAVVDDWNFSSVHDGTHIAFEKLKYQVLFERAMPGNRCDDTENWWNGMYIALVRKPR